MSKQSMSTSSKHKSRLVRFDHTHGSSTATIYIKGLFSECDPDNIEEVEESFRSFREQHKKLIHSGIWPPDDVYGYPWKSGKYQDLLLALSSGFIGLPGFRYAGISPTVGLGLFGPLGSYLEVVRSYHCVKAELLGEVPNFAADIKNLRKIYKKLRVVAHSLGCLLAARAAASLHWKDRPSQLVLLAPAMCEDDEEDVLELLAQDCTWLCYSEKDKVLEWLFPRVSDGKALGQVGLTKERFYQGMRVVDIGEKFDFGHMEYEDHFADVVEKTNLSLPMR